MKSTLSILEQSSSEDMSISTIYNLENVTAINKKVLVDELLLSPDIFDPKGDRCEGWGINETRGGEKYIPPIGWIGIGLKVMDKYGDNKWIGMKNIPGEWCVAYHGVGGGQSSDEVKSITGKITNNYSLSVGKISNTILHG